MVIETGVRIIQVHEPKNGECCRSWKSPGNEFPSFASRRNASKPTP
jgi:hypothetical protein